MNKRKHKIAIVGGGSWATAMIKILVDNRLEKEIYWWMRDEKAIEYIRTHHRNPNYLRAVEFNLTPEHLSTDINSIVNHADIIVLNVPAAFLKQALNKLHPSAFEQKILVSAIKGIIPEDNQIVGEFLQSQYNIPVNDIAVISGPCHAEEVSQEKLSYLTIASQAPETAALLASLFTTSYIKTTVSGDVYGTEYGAVLKNIYAVASGICHGIGFGDNFQAVLISNALREMERFVTAMHPIDRDIKESVYLGDLLVTTYSQFSRNRTFGNMIGKGYTVNSAHLEMNMVAEGYFASKSIHLINKKHQVVMPICQAVYAILYEKKSPVLEMKLLADLLS